jgi:tetratricopeptide (TPR) repeat protein
LQRAEEALALCRSVDPVPAATEARLLGTVASAHVASLEWDKAIEFYEAAIKAAGPLINLRRLAMLYSDVGSAHLMLGRFDAALTYATRSVALLETFGDRIALARSENDLGLVFIKRRDLSAARQHLSRSLQLCEETGLQAGRSQVLLSLCELCLLEGRIEEAKAFAENALELAERRHESGNVADAQMWLGQVADHADDPESTDRHFEAAIRGFEAFGLSEPLLQCHSLYAEILERRGDVANAYHHMREAFQRARPGLPAVFRVPNPLRS